MQNERKGRVWEGTYEARRSSPTELNKRLQQTRWRHSSQCLITTEQSPSLASPLLSPLILQQLDPDHHPPLLPLDLLLLGKCLATALLTYFSSWVSLMIPQYSTWCNILSVFTLPHVWCIHFVSCCGFESYPHQLFSVIMVEICAAFALLACGATDSLERFSCLAASNPLP